MRKGLSIIRMAVTVSILAFTMQCLYYALSFVLDGFFDKLLQAQTPIGKMLTAASGIFFGRRFVATCIAEAARWSLNYRASPFAPMVVASCIIITESPFLAIAAMSRDGQDVVLALLQMASVLVFAGITAHVAMRHLDEARWEPHHGQVPRRTDWCGTRLRWAIAVKEIASLLYAIGLILVAPSRYRALMRLKMGRNSVDSPIVSEWGSLCVHRPVTKQWFLSLIAGSILACVASLLALAIGNESLIAIVWFSCGCLVAGFLALSLVLSPTIALFVSIGGALLVATSAHAGAFVALSLSLAGGPLAEPMNLGAGLLFWGIAGAIWGAFILLACRAEAPCVVRRPVVILLARGTRDLIASLVIAMVLIFSCWLAAFLSFEVLNEVAFRIHFRWWFEFNGALSIAAFSTAAVGVVAWYRVSATLRSLEIERVAGIAWGAGALAGSVTGVLALALGRLFLSLGSVSAILWGGIAFGSAALMFSVVFGRLYERGWIIASYVVGAFAMVALIPLTQLSIAMLLGLTRIGFEWDLRLVAESLGQIAAAFLGVIGGWLGLGLGLRWAAELSRAQRGR